MHPGRTTGTTAAALLLTSAAIAQQSPTWTTEEAAIPLVLRAFASYSGNPKLERLQPLELTTVGAALGKSRDVILHTLAGDADGNVRCGGYALRMHDARSGATGAGFVVYAWPVKPGAGTRAFAVSGSGEVVSTGGQQAKYDEEHEPDWNAAVTRGQDSLQHVLRARGQGGDGQMWLPVASSETTARVRVRGVTPGDGEFQFIVAPKAWLGSTPAVAVDAAKIPAGFGTVGADGRVEITGVTAPDLWLAVRCGTTAVRDLRLEKDADGFVIAFDGDRFGAARRQANESAAIATLRNICSAQAQCQASSVIDVDADGVGEYGFFAELAGSVDLRVAPAAPGGAAPRGIRMSPPVLSTAFGNVRGGRVVRSGYVFQVFLPGTDGTWLAEADAGGAAGVAVNPQLAEERFCCYAWPLVPGTSGRRTFVVDHKGDILGTDAGDKYGGEAKPIKPDAAFTGTGKATHLAVEGPGGDGARWTPIK